MAYDHLTDDELVNYCFGLDLTPLEIELVHRLEDMLLTTALGPEIPPSPEWVQLMFPECVDGDDARR